MHLGGQRLHLTVLQWFEDYTWLTMHRVEGSRRKLTEVFLYRFIPNREGQDLQASFSLLHDDASPTTPSRAKRRTPHGELHFQKSTFSCGWGPTVLKFSQLTLSS